MNVAAEELLQKSAKKIAEEYEIDGKKLGGNMVYPVWDQAWSLLKRRRKVDWNEILRLEDHNTLDYVK